MKIFLTILQGIIYTGLFIIWWWGIDENNGLIAIGLPVAVITYWIATDKSRGGPDEPRIGGPFDGGG